MSKEEASPPKKRRNRGSPSAETKAKIAATLKGRKMSEEHKRRIGNANRGKTRTAEQRAAQSARLQAHYPESARAKISAANKGRRLTPEQRERMIANRGAGSMSPEKRAELAQRNRERVWTEEAREKVRQANLGRKLTPEHKDKISRTLKHLNSSPLLEE